MVEIKEYNSEDFDDKAENYILEFYPQSDK